MLRVRFASTSRQATLGSTQPKVQYFGFKPTRVQYYGLQLTQSTVRYFVFVLTRSIQVVLIGQFARAPLVLLSNSLTRFLSVIPFLSALSKICENALDQTKALLS